MTEFKEVLDPAIEALIAKLPAAGDPWQTISRRNWLRAMEAVFDLVYFENPPIPTVQIQLLEEIQSSPNKIEIEVVKEESKQEPHPPASGCSQRPDGIPSAFEMIRTVLTEEPGLTAKDIHARIEKRWWPGLTRDRIGPDISTSIALGKLHRDDDGKITVTKIGANAIVRAPRKETPPPRNPAPFSLPAKKVEGVDSNGSNQADKLFAFVHGERTVMLNKSELEMANALRRAMGKGFLDYQFLGLRGRGTSQSRAAVPDKTWLSQSVPVLAAKLEPLGLQIDHTDNFGYSMKEIEA